MKALFGLLVVVVLGYLAFQFMPPYFSKFQLNDDVGTIARFAGNKDDEALREEVVKKAREYDLAIKPEQVRITRDGRTVQIAVNYRYTVNLIGGKQVPIDFKVSSK